MGGLLAQMLAARGRARAMVLLTPAAPAGILAANWSVFKSVSSILRTPTFWRKPVRQTRRELEYSVLNVCPEPERSAVYDRLTYESGRAVFEMGFWFADERQAARVDAACVTCPTLVIAAEQDRLTPASLVRRVAGKYRDVATFRLCRGHGHWVLGEPGWQDILSSVLDWMENIRERPGQ
jgi:pimeloyl-ACP methyl ester carboxylesterase